MDTNGIKWLFHGDRGTISLASGGDRGTSVFHCLAGIDAASKNAQDGAVSAADQAAQAGAETAKQAKSYGFSKKALW